MVEVTPPSIEVEPSSAPETKTPEVTPDEAPESGSVPQSPQQAPPVSEDTLNQLSRQLEYYFSTVNLSRDTYLRTLRDLNDGYVPATILANFAMVQTLCPFDSYDAVIKAATNHSDNLEVVYVDKESSKKVAEEGPHTLLAIGPKDQKPIEIPVTPTTSRPLVNIAPNAADADGILSPVLGIQNTVILREVPEGVIEDDIRELFDFEKCPPIQQVLDDVSNYWFVTLSTSSRDEMVNVMLALRSKTLKGEPLKVRLKSGSIMAPESGAHIYAGDRNLPYDSIANSKKKGAYQMLQAPRSPTGGKKVSRRSNRRIKKEASPTANKQISQAPPAPFVESHFPSLEPAKAVQFPSLEPAPKAVEQLVTVSKSKDDDDDEKPVSSDGASTATTSTASSIVADVPKPKAPGGYAAALLKAPPAKPPTPPPSNDSKKEVKQPENGKTDGKKVRNGKKDMGVPKEVVQKTQAVIETVTKVVPPSWGGGRSFADVLKKEESIAEQLSS